MTTSLFISWSGQLSQKVAQHIHEWMPTVLQSVDPFLSSEDIEKGARWSDNIATKLEECGFGIIVLTEANLHAPWIMFEAGALSKMVGKSNVAPVLIEVAVSKVRPPLSQFQATRLEKRDFLRLVKSINNAGDSPIKDDTLEKTFEALWPQLESQIADATSENVGSDAEKPTEPEADLNSINLSLGDLIKTVQGLRDGLRSDPTADLHEAIHEIRHLLRRSRLPARLAPAALADLEWAAEKVEMSIEGSKSGRLNLSQKDTDELRHRLNASARHILRQFGRGGFSSPRLSDSDF